MHIGREMLASGPATPGRLPASTPKYACPSTPDETEVPKHISSSTFPSLNGAHGLLVSLEIRFERS